MAIYKAGDVVRVPFPYTDRSTRQARPALVVSRSNLEEKHGLLWVIMITSAENRGWPDDVPIPDHAPVGLPAPSIIRPAKIATIDAADAATLGQISAGLLRQVMQRVGRTLGKSDSPRRAGRKDNDLG